MSESAANSMRPHRVSLARARRAFRAALAAVALLTLVSHVSVVALIAEMSDDAERLNVAGQQRMLSQRSTMLAIAAASEPASHHAERALEALETLESNHARLCCDASGAPRERLPEAVRALYFGAPDLTGRVHAHAALLRGSLAGDTEAVAALRAYVDGDGPTMLLRDLDAAVSAWEADARARVARLQWFEMGLVGMILLVLLAEARWVFDPLLRTLNAQLNQVDDLTSRVRAQAADARLVLDTVSDGLVHVDLQGHRVGVESSVVRLHIPGWRTGEPLWRSPVWSVADADRLEAGFAALRDAELPPEVLLDQLPTTASHGARTLELAYTPVLADWGELQSVVVRTRDITEAVASRAREALDRDALRVLAIQRDDPGGVAAFTREGQRLVEALATADPSSATTLRDVHTLRGTAATFGMDHFAAWLRDVEDRFERGEGSVDQLNTIAVRWREALGRLCLRATSTGTEVTVPTDEHAAFLRRLHRGEPHAALLETCASWAAPTAGPGLERLRRHALGVAERRRVRIRVEAYGGSTRLGSLDLDPLWSALVHVARNAVVHAFGDGGPASEAARLTIAAYGQPDGTLELTLRDNGRGVDEARLRGRALAAGHDVAGCSLAELMALDGVTTRDEVDADAGRGVGMSAVASAVARVGGTLQVQSIPGLGTVFEIHVPGGALPRDERLAA